MGKINEIRYLLSNEFNIVSHVLASQLSRNGYVMRNRWWRHLQNATDKRCRWVRIVVFFVIYGYDVCINCLYLYKTLTPLLIDSIILLFMDIMFKLSKQNWDMSHQNKIR